MPAITASVDHPRPNSRGARAHRRPRALTPRIGPTGALNKINHRNNQWREAERGLERVGRRVKAPTLPLRPRARPRARGGRKSETVAGRQGRALADRAADPIRQKFKNTFRRANPRDTRGSSPNPGVWDPIARRVPGSHKCPTRPTMLESSERPRGECLTPPAPPPCAGQPNR
jgi:hypothetical protein